MFYKDTLVGNISFNSINHQLKRVDMGYWFSAEYQGRGIVTRSVAMLIEIAFTELNMEKVRICAATENQPSRKLCERLGFVLEGCITRAENLNGRVVDHAVYGLHPRLGLKHRILPMLALLPNLASQSGFCVPYSLSMLALGQVCGHAY